MRVIIGGQYYATLEGSSVQIQRSATDPVPTCTLKLIDNNSSLTPHCPQELLVLDDQVTPNPTVNMLLNSSLNPYTDWYTPPVTGITLSSGAGGMTATFSNASSGAVQDFYQYLPTGSIVPGQAYTISYYAQSASPVNIQLYGSLTLYDAAGNSLYSAFLTGASTTPGATLTRYATTITAPAGTAYGVMRLALQATANTNSGSITQTQAQWEPNWIPTLSYPTPWCGPSQTNCQQLPLGWWIRQYRKFAGFVTRVWPQGYIGNKRTIQIDASGYAWLLSLIYGNDSFTNQADSAVITTLINKYLKASPIPNVGLTPVAMLTTTYVVQGVTVSSTQLNWDDLRGTFDSLVGLSGYYWTISYYWDFIYVPPGYISQGIGLILDNSSQPDNVVTFPGYNFSAEEDFSQPGSNILVIGGTSGATTYTSQVIDPSQIAQLGILTGYSMPVGTSWMRKVQDSSLLSNADCAQRGLAELMLYDKSRYIYHVSTNVELVPGESIQVTSATDGLSAATLLVQQTTARWKGTPLNDLWEYQSDLGSINRTAIKLIARIFRQTQKGSSAPAIGLTQLSVIEGVNVVEGTGTSGSLISNYTQSILLDTPLGLWPFGEITGTIADDIGGSAYQGTLNGGITLGATGLLTDAADSSATAFAFNGSTGYIGLPATFIPTGAHAWSVECWCKVAVVPSTGNYNPIMAMGAPATKETAGLSIQNVSGTTYFLVNLFGAQVTAPSGLTVGSVYHVVGTYDGTNVRLYINGSLVAGPTAFAMNLVASQADVGGYNANYFNGTIQYPAFYNYALSATQVSAHYTAGT